MVGASNYSNFGTTGSPSWTSGQMPSWRGGTFDGWRHVKSMFSLDFQCNQAMCDEANIFAEAAINLSRSSSRILKNGDALFQTFGTNELALVSGAGAFIGGQFTNKIRNPRGEGGIVGTVGVTNKCTGYNAKPTTAVGIATSGDASGVVSIVNSLAALQAVSGTIPTVQAGLDNGFLSGNVWRGDNSVGSTTFFVKMPGACGNTNNHSVRGLVRLVSGSGSVTIGIESGGQSSAAGASFGWLTKENFVPGNSSYRWQIAIPAGCIAEWILFSLEQAATAASVPTVVAGASATGALPTNWGYNSTGAGLACAFVGVGTRYGLPYTRVRFSGTMSFTATPRFFMEAGSNAAVASGQAWGEDFYVERISGAMRLAARLTVRSNTNLDTGLRIVDGVPSLGSAFQRLFTSLVVADASASNVGCGFVILGADGNAPSAGSTYDSVYDIFTPKAVQLSVTEGPELVTDGGFNNGLTNWHDFPQGIGSTLVVNGAANMVEINSTNRGRIGSLALMNVVANSTYKTSFKHTGPQVQLFSSSGLDGAGTIYSSPSSPLTVTEVVRTGFFVPTATTAAIFFQPTGATAGTVVVDDVSVKQQIAGYMPDYPILPTIGVIGDSSCAADILTARAPDWVANVNLAAGMTELVAVKFSHVGAGVARVLFNINDGTEANSVKAYINSDDRPELQIISAGVQQITMAGSQQITVGSSLLAFGWDEDGGYIIDQSGNVTTFSAINLPLGLVYQQLGGDSASHFLGDMLMQVQTSSMLSVDEVLTWIEREKNCLIV